MISILYAMLCQLDTQSVIRSVVEQRNSLSLLTETYFALLNLLSFAVKQQY